MKTQPIRQDKNCLNCGADVPQRYCTVCGQENTVQHETFGHLVKHFTADIFHYDSQFLTTLKSLLFKPGFLTREYLAGRRVRYVNPIKLYVFVSFVFFFGISFLYPKYEPGHHKKAKASEHSVTSASGEGSSTALITDSSKQPADSLHKLAAELENDNITLARFDSLQKILPDSLRMQGAEAWLQHRSLDLKSRYTKDNLKEAIVEMFQHNVPKLMFVLLPLFALFMRWFYDRKKWLYADHAIFAMHLHSFLFIVGLIFYSLDALFQKKIILEIGYFIAFSYFVLALYNNFRQSLIKSFFKATALFFIYSFTIGFVFTIYLMLIFALFL
ncbi:DUF3667 domain-containing protein [Chitinophaga silvatica]|uniref:DUF3667 domain-containing protein n=1 Tax=Chitinophaga silvatica TaxID=2282649 RepID=A0A3E1Y7C2_9BACT|nr:DUF3667 domain-containing protein [Chitinophaga silvatica]RFS20643.1 DUF3667 domain-containing protein [Chitinophaga silvatica]